MAANVNALFEAVWQDSRRQRTTRHIIQPNSAAGFMAAVEAAKADPVPDATLLGVRFFGVSGAIDPFKSR